MSTTYSAGIATAYGSAVRGGYTGTYEQWCALMADLGNTAQRAEDASEAAQTAQGKAEAAQGKAEDAQTAAETAQGKAEDAQTAAETAQGKAEDAQAAAETAQGKAEDAEQAIEDLGVTSSTLQPGSSATVTKTVDPQTGAVTLSFGIPKGDKGDTGNSSIVAADYSSSATYAVGDYCINSGTLYRCVTAISTAENWTAAHWTAVTVGGDLGDLKSHFDELGLSVVDGKLCMTYVA